MMDLCVLEDAPTRNADLVLHPITPCEGMECVLKGMRAVIQRSVSNELCEIYNTLTGRRKHSESLDALGLPGAVPVINTEGLSRIDSSILR